MFSRIKLNIHSVFFVLFLLSVLSPPVAFEHINVLMVVAALASILLLSLKVLFEDRRYIAIFNEYRVEIALIGGYALVSFVALLMHIEVFEGSIFALAFYGLSPIAIWCSMPLIWLVFKFSDANSKAYWLLGWSVFVVLAVVGIWQVFDYQGAKTVTQFFVANDRLDPDDGNVSSLTRISTDFGVIMAFAGIASAISFGQTRQTNLRRFFIALTVLFCIAGLLSGSRNFLLTAMIGTLLLSLKNIKKNYLLLLAVGGLFVVGLSLLSLVNEGIAKRFAVIFPFLAKLQTDQVIGWRDMLFIFQDQVYTSGRALIWSYVIETWKDNFFFGTSHRSFNIVLAQVGDGSGIGSITTSSHNIIMQSIVDGGLIGLCIMLTLIYRIYRRCAAGNQTTLFLVVLLSMMVDYYLDHSLPWMICAGWVLNVYRFTPDSWQHKQNPINGHGHIRQ